jgi:hypothetical protein
MALIRRASIERAIAEESARKRLPNWVQEQDFRTRDATRLEAQAEELLTPAGPLQINPCGEVVPPVPTSPDDNVRLYETLSMPQAQLAADASRARLDLIAELGTLEVSLDAARSIAPRNSLEKMLAHQLGAAHVETMNLLKKAQVEANRIPDPKLFNWPAKAPYQIEAVAKLINAAARLMDNYQRGLLTLARLRSGGQQTVKVVHVHQHVVVAEGAQAVVAGNLDPAGVGGVQVRGQAK